MTASEWAAWVQAIGSIMAIGAAGWLPLWHRDKLEERRQKSLLTTLCALSAAAESMTRHIESVIRDEASRRGESMLGDKSQYKPLLQSVTGFPSHELTDGTALAQLFELRRIVERGNWLWQMIIDHGEEDPPTDWDDPVQAALALYKDSNELHMGLDSHLGSK